MSTTPDLATFGAHEPPAFTLRSVGAGYRITPDITDDRGASLIRRVVIEAGPYGKLAEVRLELLGHPILVEIARAGYRVFVGEVPVAAIRLADGQEITFPVEAGGQEAGRRAGPIPGSSPGTTPESKAGGPSLGEVSE